MPNPFDDIRNLIESVPSGHSEIKKQIKANLKQANSGLKPLGQLGKAVAWLGSWQNNLQPEIQKPLVAVFIGSHLVAKAFVDGDLIERAQERMKSVSDGRAAVRGIASAQGAAFKVFDMGLSNPAADMSEQASLSERECAAAIAFGMEVAAEGADIIVLGNAGLGTATSAAGIARGLFGGAAGYWAGGQGGHAQKRIELVERAAQVHKNALNDPLQILRCFGGRDIAGMVGAIVAAGHQKIPILLDGYAVCAAAAIVHAVNPDALEHCRAAHLTIEPAHGALLDRIGKRPMLELGIGIGDGSGAALALGVLKSAAAGNAEL